MIKKTYGCAALASACLTACSPNAAASDEPIRQSQTAQSATAAVPARYAEFVSTVRRADAVAVARLTALDVSDERPDGFLTTSHWQVTRLVSGAGIRPGETLTVRLPTGRRADGQWEWAAGAPTGGPQSPPTMHIGDEYLLLLSRATYEAQAKARGGAALPGMTGAGLGLHKVTGRNRIEAAGWFEAPATVDELQNMTGE